MLSLKTESEQTALVAVNVCTSSILILIVVGTCPPCEPRPAACHGPRGVRAAKPRAAAKPRHAARGNAAYNLVVVNYAVAVEAMAYCNK